MIIGLLVIFAVITWLSFNYRIDQAESRLKKLEGRAEEKIPKEEGVPPLPPTPPKEKDVILERVLPRKNLEIVIGGNWFNWIGILAIVFAISFFLKYAFENRWITETLRVIIGLFGGLALIGAGEKLQEKGYGKFALGLSGGGIAILYLSIYAANNFYHLIGYLPAFTFMALVTIAAGFLTIRYNSLTLAILATIGGFLTPVLLRDGANPLRILIGLCSYLAILDLGILGLASFKKWRILNLLGFLFTVGIFTGWCSHSYASNLLIPTQLYLILFFLIFAFIPILSSIRHMTREVNLFLVLGNAAVFFGYTIWLLKANYRNWLGLLAIAIALVYLGFAQVVRRKNREDQNLILTFLGISLVFLTIAFPLQLKQNWITIAWSLEALVLMWIGLKIENKNTRIASLIILIWVIFRLLFFDTNLTAQQFAFILNQRFFTYLVVIGTSFAITYLYAKNRGKIDESERNLITPIFIIANFLILLLLSREATDYFDFYSEKRVLRISDPEKAKQLSLSLIWIIYSLILALIGFVRKLKPLRLMAMILFGVVIFKIFFVDLATLTKFYRIFSFLILGLILILTSFLYQKYQHKVDV